MISATRAWEFQSFMGEGVSMTFTRVTVKRKWMIHLRSQNVLMEGSTPQTETFFQQKISIKGSNRVYLCYSYSTLPIVNFGCNLGKSFFQIVCPLIQDLFLSCICHRCGFPVTKRKKTNVKKTSRGRLMPNVAGGCQIGATYVG